MKTTLKFITSTLVVLVLKSMTVCGQKIDEQRMSRDIEVSENVLSTLLRQQFNKQHMFFPLEVKGNYQPGYGVTFRLPADVTTPMLFSFDRMDDNFVMWNEPAEPIEPVEPMEPVEPPIAPGAAKVYSYSYKIEHDNDENTDDDEDSNDDKELSREKATHKRIKMEKIKADHQRVVIERRQGQNGGTIDIKGKPGKEYVKLKTRKGTNLDSVKDVYNNKMIEASKNFLADYSDLIAQLGPSEKIIITNQGEQPRRWVNKLVSAPHRSHLTIEVQKGDVSQFKQGKITRDQLLKKITVVNTEAVESVEPDLELLSSIFNRLYQPDLAKTYFIEDDLYYERLKDYGAVFYMHVYSSNQDDELFSMPTLKLSDLDQETRNKKVLELYPEFEKELKDNVLEYGRTVKSLKDNEVLVFNVKLTRCQGCGIPSSVEVSVKGSVLKDFGSGKIDKNEALTKVTVKKGANQ